MSSSFSSTRGNRSLQWIALVVLIVGGELNNESSGVQALQAGRPPSAFCRSHLYGRTASETTLFTATSSPSTKRSLDGGDDDNDRSSSSSSGSNAFLQDSKGHINPELAQRIFRWERDRRLNLQVRAGFSTREGLRWVQDLVDPSASAKGRVSNKDDLIQEGVMALMQAMTTYEQEGRPNQTFENFAKERIRRALEDYQVQNKLASSTNSHKSALSMETTVEISDPIETHYSNQDEWEVREGLVLDNGLMLKTDELVEDFLDEALQYEGDDQMWAHQQQVAAPLRDSIPEKDEEGILFTGDDPSDLSLDDLALRDMILYNVDEFLGSTLDDLESQIIQLRFGLDADPPKTQKEVAYELGISVSKVRKLQKQALQKLRNAYSNQYVGSDEDLYYQEDSV